MKKYLFLYLLTLLPTIASADSSGTCGSNITWTYVEATKTLIISGTGNLKDYSYPWNSFKQSIEKVIINDGVTSIGDSAFENCNGLSSVTCYTPDIPTDQDSVFGGIDLTDATLYVPASALKDYEETSPWSSFGTILPIDEYDVPTAIETPATENNKEFFDLSGSHMTSSQRGLLIVRDKSGKTRKVMVK